MFNDLSRRLNFLYSTLILCSYFFIQNRELKLIDIESDNNLKNKRSIGDAKLRNDSAGSINDADPLPCQTTLPKARPLNVNPSKYASLPGSTQSKKTEKSNDFDFLMTNGRTKLGIDISAVHHAVLRGVATNCQFIPETMEKEHPVTIYPGRASPVKSKSASTRKVVRSAHDLTDKKLKLHLNDESSDGEEDEEEGAITQADSPSGWLTFFKIHFDFDVVMQFN